ncbi:MAG: response regulator [Lentisphaerae bacterium]|nr:response regulator [Lentisphaerota bacterium]
MQNRKPLILAIDDEPGITQRIKEVIEERLGWDVITSNSGKNGLKTLQRHKTWAGIGQNKIDCLILDIKMPDMDGLEMLKKWRKSEGFYELMNVILLSAHEDEEKWAKATNPVCGAAAKYLKKPYVPDELIDTLEKIVIGKHGEYMRDDLRDQSYARRKELRSTKTEIL